MFTKHVIKQLSAYCSGELAADQSQLVRKHLLVCERCRKEYDEIRLGVNLARQLPVVSAPAEMWTELETLLDERSRRPAFETKTPKFAIGFSWYRFAAVSAVLIVALTAGLVWSLRSTWRTPEQAWVVENVEGNVRIGGSQIKEKGSLGVGKTIQTASSSRATVKVAMIGEVDIDPNTSVRLVDTSETEHRMALDHGRIHARISAPPRLFFVNTPSAEAIDLGCEYTLETDAAGRTLLHVTLGEVALVREGREVYVPRYAMCESWPGIGPGTPFFEDASQKFVRLLEQIDFENGGDEVFRALLSEARQRDTFTLWHLLARVEGDRRVEVLDRMIELVGLPAGISREGTLRLDQSMLDAWKDAMDTVWF